ncbi:MAG TPA: hypothetical protein VHC98_00325 [Candidatus Saccharimonadales bacterium]|nr:hypothetical protein [Candidatus Saccharimonadales bacterium]
MSDASKSSEVIKRAQQGSHELRSRIQNRLGGGLVVPAGAGEIVVPSRREQLIAGLRGVKSRPDRPDIRVIPVGQNLARLRQAIGEIFALRAGDGLYPGIITARSTDRQLIMTYLAAPEDRLQERINLNDLQRALLQKAALLQMPEVGSHTADRSARGRELGHTVLAFAGVVNPTVLQGTEHAVHRWTEGAEGIAPHVTGQGTDAVAVYDIQLNDRWRRVEERSAVLGEGSAILDHPSFGETAQNPLLMPEDFAMGLGLVALNSREAPLGTPGVSTQATTARIIDVLQRL